MGHNRRKFKPTEANLNRPNLTALLRVLVCDEPSPMERLHHSLQELGGRPWCQKNRTITKVLDAIAEARCREVRNASRRLGYRRVKHLGLLHNRLELEFKCIVWNLRCWVKLAPAA